MSDPVVIENAPAVPVDHLDADEVIVALDSLSPDEKLKLHAIEKVYLGGTGFSPNELLHDAMCRAIIGKRKCPRDVAFVAFLVETMRSIAYHDRKKRRREPPLPSAPRPDGEDDDGQPDITADQLTPEEHLLEQEAVDTITVIHRHFDGDDQAQMVLLGWADEMHGKELREFVGVDQAGLDYAIKRIRRVMKKHYPNGWTL
jgi:DNA-directed RNA polymerase specialized sigma24 family protein